ncbi:MAG: hypothetical protein U0X91_05590 [Spirosomataceae bacterium]
MKPSKSIISMLFVSTVFYSSTLFAQASLASEDIIENVPITVAGEKIIYSLVRDGSQKNQWYYIPSQVRIVETQRQKGQNEPEFTLIKYQFKNPKNSQELLEGGVIQFSVVMAPDNEGFDQLRNFIVKKTNSPSVRLAALPLKSAAVTLITPKGEFLAENVEATGIAPTMANNKMVFSVPLTKIGTDVYNALANSNTGMGVVVKYVYNGLTPPAGFKITVDWKNLYDFFAKNEKIKASVAGAYSWFGVSAKYSKEKEIIRQQVLSSKAVTVDATLGEKFDEAAMHKYLDPIITKIQEEFFIKSELQSRVDSMVMADALDDAKPMTDSKGKNLLSYLSVSGGKSIKMKDIKIEKKDKQVYEFRFKQLVDRMSITGGFVGIGKYPEEIKKKLIFLVPEGRWESAFFLLPSVTDNDEIGIRQVDLQIGLKSKEKAYNTQVVVWTKEKGWTDKDGKNRNVIAFPLMELAKNDAQLKNIKFDVIGNITLGNDVLRINQQVETFSGEAPIATPLALVDIVSVQPELLSFSKLNTESSLDFVNVLITDGNRRFSKKLFPFSKGGIPEPPKPLYWIVARDKNHLPVKADIVFNLKDGSVVKWQHNQKSLYESEVGLDIVLRDIDYTKSN